MSEPLLSVRNLNISFSTDFGVIEALRGVSFDVPRGQVTAIVGESGSGKSVTAAAIMRLIESPGRVNAGSIRFAPRSRDPYDTLRIGKSDPRLYDLRGGLISMVFQEPMTALSPVHRLGDQVAEAILCHRDVSRAAAWRTAVDMLAQVGIPEPEQRARMYPFQFSGGMRQRVVIAMALVCEPELLICDEPTTALDVTVQAEILTLLREQRARLDTSMLFITHDLGVVAQIADQVVVMFQGRVLEIGSVRQILKDPLHPYTRGLLAAVPSRAGAGSRLPTIASVVGDADITSPHPLVKLADGRQVSLPPEQLQALGQ